MTHRSLRLCALFGAVGISATGYSLALAGAAVWQAARRGDLVTMPWSPSSPLRSGVAVHGASRVSASLPVAQGPARGGPESQDLAVHLPLSRGGR
ncbi:hypothetical protein D8770_20830 [Methylobacterium sp. DB1607]|nr:hypothetical protein [Methylobacterium sp. DB1607]